MLPPSFGTMLIWTPPVSVSAGFEPVNQDGEVSAFECLAPAELARRIAGQDFSADAAAVSACWLASLRRG